MTKNSEKTFGFPVPNWVAPPAPTSVSLDGAFARVETLDAETHAAMLYQAYVDGDAVWDYLPYGPFSSASQYYRWVRDVAGKPDPHFVAIKNKDSDAWEGVASFMSVVPKSGSIEVGHINLSPRLQGTRASTEALFLMMQWIFDSGYRRFEWKCDSLNVPSRRAAQRLGLSYEGIFRQATVTKGRNRDTAWFAAIDSEWPALKEAFSAWLRADNFDADGVQKERLGDLTGLVRVASDPTLAQ